MSALNRWLTRAGAVLGTAALAVFVPVAAWAASETGTLAVEAARRRRGLGGGIFGALCCLVVVGLIVVGVLLLMRNRRSGPPR